MKIDSWGNGEAVERIRLYKIQLLKEYHDQMSDKAKERFALVYPNGLESVPEKDIISAIELCERTVYQANKRKDDK